MITQHAQLRCDFCGAPNPAWRWPTEDFTMPDWGWASDGDFAACDGCNALILAHQWLLLAKRSAATTPDFLLLPTYNQLLIEAAVLKMHQLFASHRTTTLPERITPV